MIAKRLLARAFVDLFAADIVVRAAPDGGIVRLKDVARIELGAQDYTLVGRLNGKPSAIIAVCAVVFVVGAGRSQYCSA